MNEDYNRKIAIARFVRVLHMAEQRAKMRLVRTLNEVLNRRLSHFQPIKEDYKTIVRREKSWDLQF